LCVHVRPESILRYVTICHHLSERTAGQPFQWPDSVSKGRGNAEVDISLGTPSFTGPMFEDVLVFAQILFFYSKFEGLMTWTISNIQCKMQVNAFILRQWLLELYSIAIMHKCSQCSFCLWIVSVCGFWQRDQLASDGICGLGQETPDTVSIRMASTEEVPNSSFRLQRESFFIPYVFLKNFSALLPVLVWNFLRSERWKLFRTFCETPVSVDQSNYLLSL
jgi:hypothetical protein